TGVQRAAVLQDRIVEMRMTQQQMVAAWTAASSQVSELDFALARQHDAALGAVAQQVFHVEESRVENKELELKLDVQREQLEMATSKISALQREVAVHETAAEEAASLHELEAKRWACELETQMKLAHDSERIAFAAWKEEALSLSDALELAEQLAGGHERRNSELSEQLAARRCDLATLKAKLGSHEAAKEDLDAQEMATEVHLQATLQALRQSTTAQELTESCLAREQAARELAVQELAKESSRLRACEEKSRQLEERLSAQLRQLDPSVGHSMRGVSVHHMSTCLIDKVLDAGL
ncbi:unnamed protein product, partial [Polarella glacialis]